LSIDPVQKRIGIALVDPHSAVAGSPRESDTSSSPAPRPIPAQEALAPGTIVTGKIERHEKFGVMVFLSPGRTGLMPFAETGLERDADVRKAFPVGSEVEVVVLEADPANRRIRLSRKAVAEQREKAEVREYAERPDAGSAASIGSLGDSLRGALKGR
jgi:small subunit ribosomal protein S1